MNKIRSSEEIAQRIMGLRGLVVRCQNESYLKDLKEPTKRQEYLSKVNKLNSRIMEECMPFITPKEASILLTDLGSWDMHTYINASWRVEALGTILWASGVIEEMPPYDEEFSHEGTIELALPMVTQDITLDSMNVRSEEEISRQREITELWHWRARTSQMIKENLIPKNFDESKLMEICKISARESFKSGYIPQPIDDDFPAYQKAYKDLTDKEYSICTSIAIERHFALNWLCCYSEEWDLTPTDT